MNAYPDRLDLRDEHVMWAKRHGVKFAIDTDAHAPGQLDWQDSGCMRAEDLDITPERVINTRTADDMVRGR